MIDAAFLAGLRAVAEQSAEALADRASLARDADQYQAAEVADIASNGFAELAELAGRRLATGRARLAADVRDAESRLATATAGADASERELTAERPDGAGRAVAQRQRAAWDRAEDAATRALETARSALAAFDAATAGGQ